MQYGTAEAVPLSKTPFPIAVFARDCRHAKAVLLSETEYYKLLEVDVHLDDYGLAGYGAAG
jgi:hypothetical protein